MNKDDVSYKIRDLIWARQLVLKAECSHKIRTQCMNEIKLRIQDQVHDKVYFVNANSKK